MDEHDLDGGTLLVVVGRGRRLIKADRQKNGGRGHQPRQYPRGQRQEPCRVGEIGQRHGQFHWHPDNGRGRHRQCGTFCSIRPPRELIGIDWHRQSSPCRRLAAAANGPMTKLISDSAHRIENGVPHEAGPEIAASEAATPKINTGIDSGSTSTASSNPPRRNVTASAAPIMPVKVSAGVPASSVSATAEVEAASRFSNNCLLYTSPSPRD